MLNINELSVFYDKTPIIQDLSIEFIPGKIYSIVGPSGCGKTTLFKTITGIITPKKGKISWGKDDHYSIMMQNDTLLPWRTIKDNIRLGAELTTKEELTDIQIESLLKQFELNNISDLYPNELSAGMKQRVSIIQSIVSKTNYLFLDEPFSNLDFDVKLIVQKQLLDIHSKIENTMVIVTHDIEDAISLSDYVIILSNQPTKVKQILPIELNSKKKDPIVSRSNQNSTKYFDIIWNEIKYYTKP